MKIDNCWYDYDKQVWVINGKYQSCWHPASMKCTCYGKLHKGELAVKKMDE